MAIRESQNAADTRWKQLEYLQSEYTSFIPFLEDVMAHLGFSTTEVQRDIAAYLQYGPAYLMVQAQRGEAKTTITAAFVVWCIIHRPALRALIVSAGGTQANEISTLIVRIIMTMDILECLKPDRNNGDRVSVEAFDVHYTLKGVDKSPSVACAGVTANLQGKRADLLVADDVESAKNSLTAMMREQLLNIMRDFPSICNDGRIVYLGTPQSMESIYGTLPGSGFDVRIWPGRYPTAKQMEHYGDMLAPYIKNKLLQDPLLGLGGGLLGDQGRPTDPELPAGREEQLQKKEMAQGAAFFQLQHMLNTTLTDALRYPLKPSNLVVMQLTGTTYFPTEVHRGITPSTLKQFKVHSLSFSVQTPYKVSEELSRLQGIVMYVDPAGGGQNADETGYAVTGFLNGNIFLLAAGGIPGGFGVADLESLANVAGFWKPEKVIIEKNFGYGAFREIFAPILTKMHKCAIEDDMVSGQKERRIIGTLEPVIGRGSLIINEDIISTDEDSTMKYSASTRLSYSLFQQITKISKDKGALKHDDRLDAVEGAVRYWVALLMIDQEEAIKRARAEEMKKWASDPMSKGRYGNAPSGGQSILSRRLR